MVFSGMGVLVMLAFGRTGDMLLVAVLVASKNCLCVFARL